jgi:hypothetical protein
MRPPDQASTLGILQQTVRHVWLAGHLGAEAGLLAQECDIVAHEYGDLR